MTHIHHVYASYAPIFYGMFATKVLEKWGPWKLEENYLCGHGILQVYSTCYTEKG